MTNRYEQKDILKVVKFEPERPISCLHYEGEHKIYYIKRFKIETTTMDKKFLFISDTKNSRLLTACLDKYPRIEIKTKADKKAAIEKQTINIDEFVEVRGWKAIGQKINTYEIVEVKLLEPKAEEVISEQPGGVPLPVSSEQLSDNENHDNQEDDKQLALF